MGFSEEFSMDKLKMRSIFVKRSSSNPLNIDLHRTIVSKSIQYSLIKLHSIPFQWHSMKKQFSIYRKKATLKKKLFSLDTEKKSN